MANHDRATEAALRRERTADGNAIPKSDLLLDATGADDTELPALIQARIEQLEIGGVLEVVTDDPDAAEAVLAWIHASDNELVADREEGDRRRFYLLRQHPPVPPKDPWGQTTEQAGEIRYRTQGSRKRG